MLSSESKHAPKPLVAEERLISPQAVQWLQEECLGNAIRSHPQELKRLAALIQFGEGGDDSGEESDSTILVNLYSNSKELAPTSGETSLKALMNQRVALQQQKSAGDLKSKLENLEKSIRWKACLQFDAVLHLMVKIFKNAMATHQDLWHLLNTDTENYHSYRMLALILRAVSVHFPDEIDDSIKRAVTLVSPPVVAADSKKNPSFSFDYERLLSVLKVNFGNPIPWLLTKDRVTTLLGLALKMGNDALCSKTEAAITPNDVAWLQLQCIDCVIKFYREKLGSGEHNKDCTELEAISAIINSLTVEECINVLEIEIDRLKKINQRNAEYNQDPDNIEDEKMQARSRLFHVRKVGLEQLLKEKKRKKERDQKVGPKSGNGPIGELPISKEEEEKIKKKEEDITQKVVANEVSEMHMRVLKQIEALENKISYIKRMGIFHVRFELLLQCVIDKFFCHKQDNQYYHNFINSHSKTHHFYRILGFCLQSVIAHFPLAIRDDDLAFTVSHIAVPVESKEENSQFTMRRHNQKYLDLVKELKLPAPLEKIYKDIKAVTDPTSPKTKATRENQWMSFMIGETRQDASHSLPGLKFFDESMAQIEKELAEERMQQETAVARDLKDVKEELPKPKPGATASSAPMSASLPKPPTS